MTKEPEMSIAPSPDPTAVTVVPTATPGGDGRGPALVPEPPKIAIRDLSVFYGRFRAVKDVTLDVAANRVTAIIGPSGCGKSTVLRTLNRMTDLVPDARATGEATLDGQNILDPGIDVVDIRRRVGMVFQRPNPFPKSIFDNVAFGPKIAGFDGDLAELVEVSLRRAALWDEVKDKLKESGLALSGGQQQRLCIARAIATSPDVILMDEPCSALDPEATRAVEDLIWDLRGNYTILIVTHNMAQARRASDECAFMLMGRVVEHAVTEEMFVAPHNKQTADYIEGRFG